MSRARVIAASGLAAGGAAVAAEVANYAVRRRRVAALRARCRAERTLALTYDDGPGPDLTPLLLDVLAGHDAKATFFALGSRARHAPDVLDAVAAAGHEIGAHTLAHHDAWRVAPWTALADISDGYDALARWVPANGRFRPPYGKETSLTRAALRRRGAPVTWWTADSGDTFGELPPAEAVVEQVRADGGGVVLLHDHSDDRPAARLEFVLDVTERLLHAAAAEGWSVRRLAELEAPAGAAGADPSTPAHALPESF